MTEQWQELKETITEMRDNGGTGTQQGVCKFLANYMETLEKQMQQPCEDCINRKMAVEAVAEALKNTFVEYEDIAKKIIGKLPSVTPQASEEDIHREREQAYMLGYEDASKKFRTEPYKEVEDETDN